MNMVKVFIKGQEDKELSSFLRYYPTRIKNVGIDGVFDRQTIFDFKDGCNQPQVAQFVAKELVRKFGRKIGKVVFSCVPASSQERNELCTCMSVVGSHRWFFPCQGQWRAVCSSWHKDEERGSCQAT